jgi:hypothetical protein
MTPDVHTKRRANTRPHRCQRQPEALELDPARRRDLKQCVQALSGYGVKLRVTVVPQDPKVGNVVTDHKGEGGPSRARGSGYFDVTRNPNCWDRSVDCSVAVHRWVRVGDHADELSACGGNGGVVSRASCEMKEVNEIRS